MKNYLDSIDREVLRARAEQMLDYANNAKDQAFRWSELAESRTRALSTIDFAILKICILTFGVWLGSCFSKFFRKFRGLLFAAFAVSWLYLFWRIFFDSDDN